MGLISVNIPQVGAPRETEEADTTNTLTTVVSAINGGLDNANLSGSAGITDANLASPSNAAWKTISECRGYATSDAVTGSGSYFISDGGGVVASGGAIPITPPAFVAITNDHDVAGKTTQLRMRAEAGSGGANPGASVFFSIATYGLLASNLTIGTDYGLGVPLTPTANTTTGSVSTTTVNLAGVGVGYVFYMFSDFAFTSGTGIWFHAALQVRNV